MVTILNVEMKTTSTGKPYKSAKIDEQVLGKDRFNIFGFHTRYEDVVAGRAFEATDFEKDGEYIKLRDPDAGIKKPMGGPRRGGADPLAIARAQEHKADLIRGAQDSKAESIKISSTARDATLILTSRFNGNLPEEEWRAKWVEYRKWLWDNWEHEANSDEIPF